jgi:hypothetical protein
MIPVRRGIHLLPVGIGQAPAAPAVELVDQWLDHLGAGVERFATRSAGPFTVCLSTVESGLRHCNDPHKGVGFLVDGR